MIDRENDGTKIGTSLVELSDQLFHWWHRVRDGTLARSSFQKYVGPLRHAMREQLERGAECSCKKTAGTCRKLLRQESWLWTFVWVEGIEPTNNDAERVLRHAVLWRKSSGGTDSEAGSRFVERMLSVVATARRQNRNVLELLTACCAARLAGSAARGPGAGRRLIGQPSLGRADSAANPHQKGIPGPISKNSGISWGGKKTVATPRISTKLRGMPFGKVTRRGRVLNGYSGRTIATELSLKSVS